MRVRACACACVSLLFSVHSAGQAQLCWSQWTSITQVLFNQLPNVHVPAKHNYDMPKWNYVCRDPARTAVKCKYLFYLFFYFFYHDVDRSWSVFPPVWSRATSTQRAHPVPQWHHEIKPATAAELTTSLKATSAGLWAPFLESAVLTECICQNVGIHRGGIVVTQIMPKHMTVHPYVKTNWWEWEHIIRKLGVRHWSKCQKNKIK